MTYLAFSGSVDSLSQEIVDLFHLAGEYTPATSQEISKTRITESSVRASWLLLRCVNEFDLNTYDPDVSADSDPRPFSYGRDPFSVASDLTKIALEMTRANRLDINNLDIATTWTQNSIDRACSMVRSEYTLITDRSLRSCFRDELFSEASLGRIDSLYPKILERINASARHAYILVEKNALDAMSATAYAHYLPKKEAQGQNENKKNQQPSASQPPTRVIPPITSGFSAFMSNRSSRNDGLKTTETLLPDASLTPAAIDAPETLDETLDQQREPNHPASPVFSPSKFTIQRQKNAS
jgi:hypothetical protein